MFALFVFHHTPRTKQPLDSPHSMHGPCLPIHSPPRPPCPSSIPVPFLRFPSLRFAPAMARRALARISPHICMYTTTSWLYRVPRLPRPRLGLRYFGFWESWIVGVLLPPALLGASSHICFAVLLFLTHICNVIPASHQYTIAASSPARLFSSAFSFARISYLVYAPVRYSPLGALVAPSRVFSRS